MKVVIAIDSLKGSLTSLEAGEAIREGVLRAIPEAEVVVRPLADGGEGTVEALTLGMGGRMEKVTVTGPLGRPVECAYGLLPEEKLAICEYFNDVQAFVDIYTALWNEIKMAK